MFPKHDGMQLVHDVLFLIHCELSGEFAADWLDTWLDPQIVRYDMKTLCIPFWDITLDNDDL